MRLFIALPLPDTVIALLQSQQQALKNALPNTRIRWSDPAQLHLTLVFLGEVEARDLPLVTQGLEFACRRVQPFGLETTEVGAFPSLRRASVLWTGVTGQVEVLETLHSRLVGQLEGLYRPDKRTFKPHLTLGRVRQFGHDELIGDVMTALEQKAVSWQVEEVWVVSSNLKPTGAVHEVQHTVVFKSEET